MKVCDLKQDYYKNDFYIYELIIFIKMIFDDNSSYSEES